jgi:hypothetical protein
VGTSIVSIEPEDETVSLALAGYAVPYAGRFSLTWEDKGLLQDVTDAAHANNTFYVLQEGGALSVLENADPKTNQRIGIYPQLQFIAACNNVLYGIFAGGKLSAYRPSAAGSIWETIGYVKDVTAFTASNDYLYVATSKDELLAGSVSGDSVVWEKTGQAKHIISMASDHRRLYAVTKDNYLLQRYLGQTGKDWQRIGYNNQVTYTVDVRQIVSSNGKLYAFGADSHFYMGKHSTEGNLSARAMAIKKGSDVVVIVGADVCGLDYSFTDDIKKEIYRRRGIPAHAIMINSSHSHFVPVTQGWRTWGIQNQYPDSVYLNHVVRTGIIQAVEEALDNMLPSYLSFGRDTTDIGHNRSLKGDLAIYDNDVDVLQAVSVDGKTKSLLFLTGCHPVFTDPSCGNYTITANFPGYARDILQKTGYANSIFLQGCAGDINPKHSFKTSGVMLATDVLRALGKEQFSVNGTIHVKLDSILVPTHPWNKEQLQAFREDNMKNERMKIPGGVESDASGRNVRWADIMLKYVENKNMPAAMPIYIQTFDIGNWKLVGLSREATTGFSIAVKNVWPGQKVSVVAYTNDVSSYLATDPHITAKDYEGYDSFFWYAQPSPFPLETFDRVIGSIKGSD